MDNNIKAMLKTLKDRPGVFIGCKSLDRLKYFISGYVQCLSERSGSPLEFLPGFQEFVTEHYELSGNIHVFRHWTGIISFFNADEEEAFDEFYRLLDIYLTREDGYVQNRDTE